MTKRKTKKPEKPVVEIDPDAFERFREAVHKLAKSRPMPKRRPGA